MQKKHLPRIRLESRLPSSRSHDSMTTGSPGGSLGGGDGDGGGDEDNDGDGGGGGGESGQGGAAVVGWYSQRSSAMVTIAPKMIYAPLEDVQMASMRVVRPGCEMWDHYVREFQTRYKYNTMMS
ncbi:hypothetical protein Taro_029456 [Colocasia esculenta]|uniref:Uncharacterized protein n=1 Tax=Colocasia esculenta TaxID=4460 RepID=A0A843VX77_COLES|nr:hypothetical protein [Colocasia esculenta]